jgi:hypothetical protein
MRLLARFTAFLLALSGTTFIALAGGAPAFAKDTDCSDYPSQAAAQHYFDSHGGGPNNNVDLLDADGDGIACESNSCPCVGAGGGGGGGGGGSTPPPKKRFHIIKVRGHEIRHTGKFEAIGSIVTFKNGRFTMQRKIGSGAFKPWKFVKTKPVTGKFRTKIKAAGSKKTCFRVVVPETKKFKKTIGKNFGCIVTD